MVEHNQITAVMEPNLNDQNSSFALDVMLLAYMQRGRTFRKQDAAHEPECTSVKQVIWGVYIFPLLPCQCTVDCGMRERVECKAWSVECGV